MEYTKLALVMMLAFSQVYADIIIDGSTNTSVSIDSAGREVINIAPANSSRISHNRYTQFDVGAQGVLINNRLSAARTIINEVTGTKISQINGDIRIQGTRAHLIIANPNGININGTTFYNTGAVGLTTGSIDYITRPTSLGGTQDHPVITTSKGTITVGEGGIAGVMNRLDLISKNIAVRGLINNEHESPFSSVHLLAGESTTEFNPNLSIADPGGQWYETEATANASNENLSVDITRPASILASSVQIVVTDKGAGVRLLGSAIASQNNFIITADGHIQIEGEVIAAGNIVLNSATAEVKTTSDKQAKIESQNAALTVNTEGSFSNLGGLLSGAAIDESNAQSMAGITLNIGSIFTQSTIGDIESQRGILFSLTDIDINADIVNNYAGRMLSNTGMTLNAREFNNTVIVDDFEGRGKETKSESSGRRLWYMGFLTRARVYKTELNYGEPISGRFSSELIATTGDITITVDKLNSIGSEITINDGNLIIDADTIYHEAALSGYASLTMTCELGGCDRDGHSSINLIGGKWQASGDIKLTASTSIENVGGTFLAINDLVLTSPLIRASSVATVDVLTRNQGLRSLFLHDDALWVQADQGGALIANMGRLVIDSDSELIIDGGLYNAGAGVESNVEINIVREPTTTDLMIRSHGGLLSDVF
ncbi:MAG: filamentous hemagglutinin N-terminal domain-containing protein [Oleispira sp.]|nr:filamentous hemagglutinin N-terminal domain-containing protein [Oleispira sp.]